MQERSQGLFRRKGKQYRERWNNYLNPSMNRGIWSEEEDIKLIDAALQLGLRWSLIAKKLANRTENAVKNRLKSLLNKEKKLTQRSGTVLDAGEDTDINTYEDRFGLDRENITLMKSVIKRIRMSQEHRPTEFQNLLNQSLPEMDYLQHHQYMLNQQYLQQQQSFNLQLQMQQIQLQQQLYGVFMPPCLITMPLQVQIPIQIPTPQMQPVKVEQPQVKKEQSASSQSSNGQQEQQPSKIMVQSQSSNRSTNSSIDKLGVRLKKLNLSSSSPLHSIKYPKTPDSVCSNDSGSPSPKLPNPKDIRRVRGGSQNKADYIVVHKQQDNKVIGRNPKKLSRFYYQSQEPEN